MTKTFDIEAPVRDKTFSSYRCPTQINNVVASHTMGIVASLTAGEKGERGLLSQNFVEARIITDSRVSFPVPLFLVFEYFTYRTLNYIIGQLI